MRWRTTLTPGSPLTGQRRETGVDAWLVRPAGFSPGQRYPVLLSIHGGPFSQYTTGFFDEFQMYAAAGYGWACSAAPTAAS